MYRKFYGLQQKPFDLTPDGNLLYVSEAHREGLATLRYGVIADKGFLMLTGGVGTGKTTMINSLLGMLKKKVIICVLNNPTLSRHEFYHYLAKKLQLRFGGNKGEFILQLSRLLDRCHKRGEKVLLIIDEAQIFPVQLLEEVRLLSNQAGDRNVLSIFLVGQPELQEKLAHPRLLPLRQRIGIRYHLPELTSKDTAQYIVYRLNVAGAANTQIFTRQAVEAIHEASRGNPRLINVICDHALVSGFSLDLLQIDRKIILECLDDIRLPGEKGLRISKPAKLKPSEAAPESRTPAEPPGQKKRRRRRTPLLWAIAFMLLLGTGVLIAAHYYGLLQPFNM